jgi:hypothetical protein
LTRPFRRTHDTEDDHVWLVVAYMPQCTSIYIARLESLSSYICTIEVDRLSSYRENDYLLAITAAYGRLLSSVSEIVVWLRETTIYGCLSLDGVNTPVIFTELLVLGGFHA